MDLMEAIKSKHRDWREATLKAQHLNDPRKLMADGAKFSNLLHKAEDELDGHRTELETLIGAARAANPTRKEAAALDVVANELEAANMSERTDRLDRLGRTTTDRRRRRVEAERQASELETLRAHASQLVEDVAGKIEAAERERDRLASEMQTAKYAISVCEGEVDELAEG